jgi:hypothetical protein
MVNAGSAIAAPFYCFFVDNDNRCARAPGIYSRMAAGNAAAEYQDIGVNYCFLTVADGIRPLWNSSILLNILVPGSHQYNLRIAFSKHGIVDHPHNYMSMIIFGVL